MNTALPNSVILASAGSGKTFQLSNRYLSLVLAGEEPECILATTFTRKAAAEILDRILSRLAAAATDAKKCKALEGELRAANAAPEVAKSATLTPYLCQTALTRLLSRLHRLQVCTLDSHFAKAASSFTYELDLPPGWEIFETMQARALQRDAVRMLLGDRIEDGQASIVDLVRLLAKGEVARSVTRQIDERVEQLRTLFLETDEAAWHPLKRRPVRSPAELAAAIERVNELPPIKPDRNQKALDAVRAQLATEDWLNLISQGLGKAVAACPEAPLYYGKPFDEAVRVALLPLVEHAKAAVVNRQIDLVDATWKLLCRYEKHHRVLQRRRRAAVFDDITRGLAVAANDDRLARAAYRTDSAIRHLLLDEFQDTSRIQWRALLPAVREVGKSTPATPDEPVGRTFFCVGDRKQAIYNWRGGDVSLFDAADEHVANLSRVPLAKSYRCSQAVVDSVNKAFAELHSNAALPQADFGAAWAERFEVHTTAKGALAGLVQLLVGPEETEEDVRHGPRLRYAADLIAAYRRQHPQRTIGVLARSNRTVAEMVNLLRGANLPVSEEGGVPIAAAPAVAAFRSLFWMMDHPGDSLSAFHVRHSPLGFAIPAYDGKTTSTLRSARELRIELSHGGYGKLVRRLTDRIASECDRSDRLRLRQLAELADRFDEEGGGRPADFANWIEVEKVADPRAETLRVMTVHQAKGLEFDAVFLPELEGPLIGRTPPLVAGRNVRGEIDRVFAYLSSEIRDHFPPELRDLAEEWRKGQVLEALCVLYVSLTRAVHDTFAVIDPSSPTESKIPSTMAGVLRAAWAPGEPAVAGKMLAEFRSGGQAVAATPTESTSVTATPFDESDEVKIDFRRSTGPRSRGLTVRNPSQLETGAAVRLADVLRIESAVARERGTALHKVLKGIEWLEPDGEIVVADEVRNELGPLAAQFDDLVADARRMLAVKDIRTLFEKRRYASKGNPGLEIELWRERRFVVRDDDALVDGTFDRAVLQRVDGRIVAAEVVDYKTDRPSKRTAVGKFVDDKAEHYRPQMKAYRQALAQLTGLPLSAVAATLAFVELGRCKTIAFPDEAK